MCDVMALQLGPVSAELLWPQHHLQLVYLLALIKKYHRTAVFVLYQGVADKVLRQKLVWVTLLKILARFHLKIGLDAGVRTRL